MRNEEREMVKEICATIFFSVGMTFFFVAFLVVFGTTN